MDLISQALLEFYLTVLDCILIPMKWLLDSLNRKIKALEKELRDRNK
jgi:hypothetical protein